MTGLGAQTGWMALVRRTDPSHEAEKADKIRQGVWALAKTAELVSQPTVKTQRPGSVLLIRQMKPVAGSKMVNLLNCTLPSELARFIAAHCLMTEAC